MFVGSENFNCSEAMTLYMGSNTDFLGHVQELAANWNAPISIAVYVDREEERTFLRRMGHILHCGINSRAVAQFVDFHIYYLSEWKPNLKMWRKRVAQFSQAHCKQK